MNTSPPSVVSAAARGVIRAWTVSEMIAAASPSFTSVSAYVASSALMARSLVATIPMPPARTAPATRVTTGLSSVAIWRCSATMRLAPSSMPVVVASVRSAPEQNTVPSWRISTTLASGSPSARSSRSASSVTSCCERAFRLCWESRVIVATASDAV